ncbi:hypothetical protein NBRC3255_1363 [Gluconobacter thailandicus NBRC 3255]|nr:hypothetical protein AD946_07520 [Gluconobacter thailandicus]GAC87702.1 hypothetical protein NBRC3255_1363 [Gluconobacter thailandicus NBRC 3255]
MQVMEMFFFRCKFIFCALLLLTDSALCAPIPQTYRDTDGQYHAFALASTLDESGNPRVRAYKDNNGQWRQTVPIVSVCSVETNGTPHLCTDLSAENVGKPNGIAGLDSKANLTNNLAGSINGTSVENLVNAGNIIAPIKTSSLDVDLTAGQGSQPLINAGRFPVVTGVANSADPFQSPDALQIGGLPTKGWNTKTGLANNEIARPGSLVIAGQPWGPFNAGTLESLLFTQNIDAQNGICTLDWRQGAGHICVGDGVGQYIGVINAPAFMVPPVSKFTATSVVLKTPLTAEQITQLRIGMYINTNIINNTRAPYTHSDTWGGSQTPQSNFYLGVISGWSADGTTINVSAWDIPQASDHPSGQFPGQQTGDTIDTFFSNYGYPVVFIGNPNNGSARNEYLAYDGSRAGDDPTGKTTAVTGGTATAHALTADEIDLRYWATRKNEVHLDGITVSVAGSFGTPMGREALTQDSFAMALSGDIHNLLKLDGPTDGNAIIGHSFYVGGGKGSDSASKLYEMSDIGAFPDSQGSSLMRLTTFMTKETDTVGPGGNAMHVGIINGGSPGDGMPSGLAAWGQVVFNQGGTNNGGVSLCGGSGGNTGSDSSCGIQVDYNGTVRLGPQVNAQGPITMMNGQRMTFAPADKNGWSYWYAPSGVGGLTLSAKTYQGGDASLTAYNGTFTGSVTARRYQETLSSPASSSACKVGEFTDDADYHYVCVAENTWKRVALSSY